MKKFITLILCSFFLVQGHAQIGDKVFKFIENRDVNGILELADREIDLCLLDNQNIYSKDEARVELNKFFTDYPPKKVERVHSGNSRSNRSAYLLGKMTAQSGESFRIFVYANAKNSIIELRVDHW